MEVAPFFVDFHHFLSIFTIFYQFSRFTHFCRDLHFVAIYALFPQFFLAKIAFSATSHVFCMYVVLVKRAMSGALVSNSQRPPSSATRLTTSPLWSQSKPDHHHHKEAVQVGVSGHRASLLPLSTISLLHTWKGERGPVVDGCRHAGTPP